MIFEKNNIEITKEDDFIVFKYDQNEELRLCQNDLDLLHEQMQRWYWFLNVVIGAASIAFAHASLGTPHPPLNAGIAIVWITIIYFGSLKTYFPHKLVLARKHSGKSVKILRKYIESEYLGGIKILTKVPFFLIGYCYLLLVFLMWLNVFQAMSFGGAALSEILLPTTCTCIPGL